MRFGYLCKHNPSIRMKELIYIFLGGGIGSVSRYLLHILINGRETLHGFPWSTFVVNILGSFLIGIFFSLSERFNLSYEVRLFLTVGLCGGFTTFSTFSNESLFLFREGIYGTLTLYILLSVVLGILAVLLGAFISK